MDRSSRGGRPGLSNQQSQTSTGPKPWRNQQNTVKSGVGPQQDSRLPNPMVDSWRSYKADTTNLESVTKAAPTLNVNAAPFQPTRDYSTYRPYQPLRTSDGTKEREVVNQARKTIEGVSTDAVAEGFGSRYPVRANRGQADHPLPSIEPAQVGDLKKISNNRGLRGTSATANQSSVSRRKTPRETPTPSPVPPSLTEKYRAQAQQEPQPVTEPRKLLVILDLNGTLLYRSKSGSRKRAYMRPGVTPVLDYLFTNHVVMIYTSCMPDTALDVVSQFIHPAQRNKLAALWARDKLGLNKEQYRAKVQVYKNLDKVWSDANIQATASPGEKWDQSNTILIDDSKLKALAQPHNLLQVPEYTKEDDPATVKDQDSMKQRQKIQFDILKQLVLKLEALKCQADVSRLIWKWQTGDIPVPRLPGQAVSVEERVDQGEVQKQKEAKAAREMSNGRSQLLTPVSVGDLENAERSLETSDSDTDEGLRVLSQDPVPEQAKKPLQDIQIPGLGMLSEEEKEGSDSKRRQSSESSIDENAFKEWLK